MPENDGRWWDTIPKEAVDELMTRQHPYHNPKKPRVECHLCQSEVQDALARKEARLLKAERLRQSVSIETKEYVPPLRKVLNALRYWPEEIE